MSDLKRPEKSIEESRTEQVHLLRYEDINGESRLFGGKLVFWIDEVAGAVARRHAGIRVTTASIDNLQFKNPAFLDELVIVVGYITYVGNTSMEVRVDTYAESTNGTRRPINRAYLTVVALGSDDRPCPIPYGITIETESQKYEWNCALKRIELRKMRRQEGF